MLFTDGLLVYYFGSLGIRLLDLYAFISFTWADGVFFGGGV